MSLHLQPISDEPAPRAQAEPIIAPVFFVIQRDGSEWDRAAKIISVHTSESVAETTAANLKDKSPQQTFGVAALRSEAHVVPEPIAIVRVPEPSDLPSFDGNQVAT